MPSSSSTIRMRDIIGRKRRLHCPLQLVKDGAQIALGFELGAKSGNGLGGANDQAAVFGQAFADILEQADLVGFGEVDGDVSAKDDVERDGKGEWLKQVHRAERGHSSQSIANLPPVAAGGKVFGQAFADILEQADLVGFGEVDGDKVRLFKNI